MISVATHAQSNKDYQDMNNDRYWVEKESREVNNSEQTVKNLEVCTHKSHDSFLLPSQNYESTTDTCKHAIIDAVESGISDKEIIDILIKDESGDLKEKVQEEKSSQNNPYVPNEIKG